MRCAWRRFFQRVACVCLLGVTSSWTAAHSYALQIAADCATNAAYDDGWQAGDNGGFGFGPWEFTGTYDSRIGQTIDISSPPNDVGRAWTLFNADGPPEVGRDVAQAGRAILGGLKPSQTLSVVVDNPTERRLYRGYTIRFNAGGGNTVYGGTPQTRIALGTFEYFTNGRWYGPGWPPLLDLDTNHGVRIDLTITGGNGYSLKMTPLDNPASAFMIDFPSTSAASARTIDWIEFELYNTDSAYYPTPSTVGGETDFYISSMEITVPEPSSGGILMLIGGALQIAFVRLDWVKGARLN